MAMKHALTIDLEDWFTVQNFKHLYSHKDWDSLEFRAEQSTMTLLDLFDHYEVKATFFVLGWVAEKAPDLIKEVARRGHEIASHGYGHEQVKEIGEKRFALDLEKSLEVIHKSVSCNVIGYRAPSFSVDPDKKWIFQTLKKFGFKYDSSIYPVSFHTDYANSGTQLTPYEIDEGLIEYPMTCIPVMGKNLPCSGGGYFRMLPYQWFKYGFGYCNKHNRSAVFYLHPWEIDFEQPKVDGLPWSKKFRHYVNQDKTLGRLEKLLSDFSFTTMQNILEL